MTALCSECRTRPAHARGLCLSCYGRAYKAGTLVKLGSRRAGDDVLFRYCIRCKRPSEEGLCDACRR